ncbi:ABC transporter substrate-binding protein [Halpernia frigidisoli]|uniref:Substrate-binding protein n=1 Tax=Halpernia frigidisoli TaxID=1125876 RepID=A0A1I3IMY7_9FLAO|nr:helical backbone metal receptor [Halpernia frigidisoli]SFI49316.1 substrate-binding protein [Halpernia frigidisoli]
MRIISLVPSITKTLFDLGLGNHDLVGRTKFCIHPENLVKNIPIIGGTKNLNIDKIKELKPDLILANKEENTKEQVEELQQYFRVWVSDIKNLKDNENFLWELGMLLKKNKEAEEINKEIETIYSHFKGNQPKKVAYLIWQNPYMTIGGDTFINEILEKIGCENIFKNRTRYPEINLEDIKDAQYLFLSTEPFPFNEKHVLELQKLLPNVKILLVDGEAFSWFGSHIAEYKKYYQNLVDSI